VFFYGWHYDHLALLFVVSDLADVKAFIITVSFEENFYRLIFFCHIK